MKRIPVLIFFLVLAFQNAAGKTFVHPGILHTQEDLSRIKSLVDNRTQPAFGSWEKLSSDPKSSPDYRIQGPFPIISRADEYGYTKAPCEDDFNAAYYNALMWAVTGDVRHAAKAMEIIRAYSAVLRKITPRDDPLCAGLQGFIIVNAAEIMRYTFPASSHEGGWNEEDTRLATEMFREAFIPVFMKFHAAPAYTNGNWGLSVLKGMVGMGVFLDDRALYREALERYLEAGYDNGSLPNYTHPTGQLQESGRDQAHCMLGLGCMAEICEVAWKQGEDLYSALDNRLLTCYEYLAKYNLGHDDLPFFTWTDKTGKYCRWTQMSPQARGQFRSVFEIAYAHYVGRRHLEMPYTAEVLQQIRPEGKGWTCDHPGFGSLLFWQGSEIYHDGWTDFNKNGRKDIYEDPSAPIGDRIRNLLSQMTLEEKTCQMVTLYGTGRVLKDDLPTPAWKNRNPGRFHQRGNPGSVQRRCHLFPRPVRPGSDLGQGTHRPDRGSGSRRGFPFRLHEPILPHPGHRAGPTLGTLCGELRRRSLPGRPAGQADDPLAPEGPSGLYAQAFRCLQHSGWRP